MLEVYGTQMRLKDVANITVPEARQILVTPFDASITSSIGKAIETSLSLHPIVEANLVRVNVPPMDEKQRKEIARKCKDTGEKAKVSIRGVRRDFNERIRKQQQDGEIPEDLKRKLEKSIQDLTNRFCEEIEKKCESKTKEIMEI